jgi:hypothetical protein
MTRAKAIKKIKKFVDSDNKLDFEERLTLIRMLKDVKSKINQSVDNIDVILLRLRYGVKQGVPLGWSEVICVPNEIDMAKDLVGEVVSREKIKRNNVKDFKEEKAKKEHVKMLRL